MHSPVSKSDFIAANFEAIRRPLASNLLSEPKIRSGQTYYHSSPKKCILTQPSLKIERKKEKAASDLRIKKTPKKWIGADRNLG
jgi:hypothetical protein